MDETADAAWERVGAETTTLIDEEDLGFASRYLVEGNFFHILGN